MRQIERKYKIKLICIIMIAITSFIVLGTTFSFAQNKLSVIDGISNYKYWGTLSEGKTESSIAPSVINIDLKDSIKRSVYNNLLKGNLTVDSKYNLKTELENIIVKNQRGTGACWAFSYSSVIETTIANKYNKISTQYSPMHIDYSTAKVYNRKVGDGGDFWMALAYSASGKGPVYEIDLPFESVYDEENNSKSSYYLSNIDEVELNQEARARIKDASFFANIYKTFLTDSITYRNSSQIIGSKTYTTEEINAIRTLIKKHIKENGAVMASFYSDMGINASGEHISLEGYYNQDTKAFYCNSSYKTRNHAVTIVGWDDNFSKDNFNESHRPLNDGAYIVLNSWGTEFGDNGYFYVSYDDSCIEQLVCGVEDIEEIVDMDYDNLYEYDETGVNIAINVVNDEQTKYLTSGYAANVFSRKDTKKIEYLSEVGLFMKSAQGVEIYVNPEDNDLTKGTLVGSYTGENALETGYHTLKLSSPIQLTGNKFAIKVKYINAEGAKVPVECNLYQSGIIEESDNIYSKVSSNVGESFYSNNGTTWVDLYNYNMLGQVTFKDTNACIKAYTTISDPVVPETIQVTGVTLSENNVELEIGQTKELTATITPENATNKNITWKSSNETVATIENGVVTAKKEGTAQITVTTQDGQKTATCKVTIKSQEPEIISVTGVTLSESNVELEIGKTKELTATIAPVNATNKNITWKSSNEAVATIENGVVTAKKEGTAQITVMTQDGQKTATCNITVKSSEPETIAVTGVTLSESNMKLKIGQTKELVATVKPENATNKNITWKSSDESVAVIENGVITAKKEGTAQITVTTQDGGKTATCLVNIESNVINISVTSIKLNKTDLIMQEGDRSNLVVTITPTNATNKKITWESSNTKVATVENGIITAISEGTTTITAKSEDGGKVSTCKLTVIKKTNTDDDIYIDTETGNGNINVNTNINGSHSDDTVASGKIPQAGIKYTIVVAIAVIVCIGVIIVVKWTKYKDIK